MLCQRAWPVQTIRSAPTWLHEGSLSNGALESLLPERSAMVMSEAVQLGSIAMESICLSSADVLAGRSRQSPLIGYHRPPVAAGAFTLPVP